MKKKMESAMKKFFGWSQVSAKKMVVDLVSYKNSNSGFTLIELIVVCTILGVLILIALPVFSDIRLKTTNARVVAEIRGLEKDVIAYATDKGDYPDDLSVIQRDGQMDPWGRPYLYYNIAKGTGGPADPYTDSLDDMPLNEYFDLYSKGVDGLTDTETPPDPDTITISSDDIIYIRDGRNVVLGSEY